ncbi:MAG: hypothetical protein ABSH11_10745 [Verrucomicrobiota bacterium]
MSAAAHKTLRAGLGLGTARAAKDLKLAQVTPGAYLTSGWRQYFGPLFILGLKRPAS